MHWKDFSFPMSVANDVGVVIEINPDLTLCPLVNLHLKKHINKNNKIQASDL